MVLKHIKICSVLLIKREMQMKSILSYHISPPKLIKDWKFHSVLCWHSREEVSTLLHFWWIKNGTRKRTWQYPKDYTGMCSLTSNSMPRDLSPVYTAKYVKSWICTRLSCKAVIVKNVWGFTTGAEICLHLNCLGTTAVCSIVGPCSCNYITDNRILFRWHEQ